MLLDKIRNILEKRASLNNEDDYNIEQCREQVIELLSDNQELTIMILNQLTDKEILFVSEVFEEIPYNLQSKEYIDCLRKLKLAYPYLNLEDSIKIAEDFMD